MSDTTPVSAKEQVIEERAKIGKIRPHSNDMQFLEVEDTRIATFFYKADKEGNKKVENAFVRLPSGHLDKNEIMEYIMSGHLLPYVQRWLADQETAMIKERHSKGGYTFVETDYLTLDNIIDYIERKKPLFKLDKDTMEQWFDECILETLVERLERKEISRTKQEPFIKQYRNAFLSLLSSNTVLDDKTKDKLLDLIEWACEDDTRLGSQIVKQINKLAEREPEELLDL